jgi:hypothetical protein
MNVNNEGTNLSRMQQFAAAKKAVPVDSYSHARMNLLHLVDVSQSTVLNGSADGSELGGPIKSDADEQLLIKLVFKENVSVEKLIFRFHSEDQAVCGPKDLELYSGQPNMDFSDLEAVKPRLRTSLSYGLEAKEGVVSLLEGSGGKFARISSLQVFVRSNQTDAPSTLIGELLVMGSAVTSYHVQYSG